MGRLNRKRKASLAASTRWKSTHLHTEDHQETQRKHFPRERTTPRTTQTATPASYQQYTRFFSGLCLVEIAKFWKQVQEIKHHPGFLCSIQLVEIQDVEIKGLNTTITFKCNMCDEKTTIVTIPEEEGKPNINFLSVLGAVSTGSGFSQLEEYHAALNIPYMSYKTFKKETILLERITKKALENSMKKAGGEEKTIAIREEGTPTISVITDGAWSKRSYKSNYNALSGVGTIIGVKSQKILHIGVKNKYCSSCDNASSKGATPKSHKCFRNWTGTSTSMEQAAIVDGFKQSEVQHGLQYTKIISDGDSSVMKKLKEAKPYGPTTCIEKLECTNHLLRNYCNKLRDLGKQTKSSSNKFVSVRLRRLLTNSILRLRTAVKMAATKRNNESNSLAEKLRLLKEDILNSPNHVFGQHDKCAPYFCQGPKDGEENTVEEMKDCGMYEDILKISQRLVQHSSSLLLNQTNNTVESFNSIICKLVGGKRINFSKSGSYQLRCEMAALSFNCEGNHFEEIMQTGFEEPTGEYTAEFIKRRQLKRSYEKLKKKENKNIMKRPRKIIQADEDYGAILDEISKEELEIKKEEFLVSIRKSKEEIQKIEIETIGQSNNPLWRQQRENRITASMFGVVVKRRTTTPPGNLIKQLLFSTFKGCKATNYGKEHEEDAIKAFMDKTGKKVRDCGIFIGEGDECFLGASPDGIIEAEDAIIEVKCPYTLQNMKITDAVNSNSNRLPFLKKDVELGEWKLHHNHNYFYQIQGQLHITQKRYCYFVIWSNVGECHIETIFRDDTFWEDKMKTKLSDFYMNNLLPAIVGR